MKTISTADVNLLTLDSQHGVTANGKQLKKGSVIHLSLFANVLLCLCASDVHVHCYVCVLCIRSSSSSISCFSLSLSLSRSETSGDELCLFPLILSPLVFLEMALVVA